jgi:drug/metabolite transporter (DMT)-like permease
MGYVAASVAFLIWGVASTALLRFIPLPGPVASAFGAFIGAGAMLAWLGPRRWPEIAAAYRAHPRRLGTMAVCFAGCGFTYHWAVKSTTVANAVLSHSLQPIATCLVLLPLLGRGSPTVRGWLALAAGMAGLIVAMPPRLELGGHAFGLCMGAASALFFAWFNVQVPFFRGKVRPDALQACNVLGAAVLMLPTLVAMDWDPPGPSGAAAILAFGIANFTVANLLYYRAMERIPVGHVATLAYLEPVSGLAAAALLVGEPLTPRVVIGAALVLGSGALIVSDRPRSATAP